MARCWLTSVLVALLCAGCDVPLYGLGDPPPEAGGSEDADAPDTYVPVPHVEAGGGRPADAGDERPPVMVKEAGATPDAHAVESGAQDSGRQTDAADEADDDGGDDGDGEGRGDDLRGGAH